MPKSTPAPTISDALLAAIHTAGRNGTTPYAIARDSGVAMGTVYRFIRGEREPSLEACDKLASYFGLELTATNGKK